MLFLNAIVFYLIWLGLVYVGNGFVPVAITLLAVHVFFISDNATKESELILSVSIIGVAVDLSLNNLGIFSFEGNKLLPAWLICLWLCFAATLNYSLRFLAKIKVLQVLVGAILAPLSYLAGNKLGVVSFGFTVPQTYLLLSIIWAVLMLIFFQIKSFLDNKEVSHV